MKIVREFDFFKLTSGSAWNVTAGRKSASCGAAAEPILPTVEHPPTAVPLTGVGNSSAVYT